MAHLKDFLLEQQALQQDYLALTERQEEAGVIDVKEFRRLFGEDWAFAYRLVEALHALCTPSTRIAFLCCPTTFVAFQSTSENIHSGAQPHLFEYDERFKTFAGAQYSYYDLHKPLDGLPEDLLGQVDVAVVDPPYLTRETNELVSQTLKALMRKGGKLILLTSQSVEHVLDERFKGIVSRPSDAAYDTKRWAFNVAKQAAYVVYPKDVEDISAAIIFAREEKLPLAITGGGHNVSGASSAEGGVVIDMREMNAIRVDKEDKIGYIQGGATNALAIKELFKHGMATTLGLCGAVGCIGLAIGGGMGFKMGKYGLACDNIVSATMVLANGDVVFVDAEHHPDLLWGIKGGGSNFGVIAELGMRLHEARPDVYTMQNIYLPEQLPAVVAELSKWLEVQTPDELIALAFSLGPEDGKPYVTLIGVADFSAEDGERLWNRFLKLGPVLSNVAQVPYDMYGALADPFNHVPGNKVQSGAHFNKFDYETVKRTYDMWLPVTSKAPFSTVMYEFYHYDLAASTPVEATAFPQRTTDKTALIGIYGYDDETALEAKQALTDIMACVSSSSTEEARKSVGYLNYLTFAGTENDTDITARMAFGLNYARLQKIKRDYDPDMVFNKWLCIIPSDA
ncbi:hypothetical protein FRB97_005256 [Tulasnella sp. 331]|nr:hypothetical protein FRB97_005256 [Tulasnella sp. 331]